MFTWSDEDLNEDQSRVVKDNRNIFLVACPGSGKTKTLTYKIAYELSCSSINNRKVVAITYTHRAADEIRERIEDLGINTARLWIGTIHAFCLEWILKPYCIYDERISSGCNIIDMHQREELLKSLCNELKSPKITNFDCDYYYTSKKIILACKDENKHGNISIVLENYFDYLRSCNLIDFELLLKISHDLIASNPKIPRLLSSLFEIILIDEFQDTKEVQYSILASILSSAKDRTRLFFSGRP
ncbi:UvrD-helicase domain-containing protein [Cobetia crustatorum]|uniref:UvrD-helicase domain-containing protein n=1 Tax=Cobetia crustatorum TaxID=553385 RepID=UPI001B7FB97C|nr:UvrD-helicase domain-containing protein [Cobetia crustatorum]